MGICIQANRFARVCLEESIKYSMKRKTFDKLLFDHPAKDMTFPIKMSRAVRERV